MGIEPTYAAWEAAVLPLNYARFGCDRESVVECEVLDGISGNRVTKQRARFLAWRWGRTELLLREIARIGLAIPSRRRHCLGRSI